MPPIRQRAARLAPYFKDGRSAWAVAVVASLVIAATEVTTAKLMKPLIDQGFRDRAIPYWLIPLVIVGVFVARGLATFVAQYALAWSTSQSVIALRRAMFGQLQRAAPGLFNKYNASNLTNTVVYEVQNGAQLITSAINTLLKDSLTLAGLLVSLLLQNWRLTLLVLVMVPTTGWVMRTASTRLRRLTDAGQKATDDLAYVMEENVLAWRIVRLHGASEGQTARFDSSNNALRRILMKSVAAGAAITPLTQVLASFALSMVVVAALWQSRSSQATTGDFISFITAMLMLITPIKHLTDVLAPIARGMSSLERCLDLIETNPLEQSGKHNVARAQGNVQLRQVSLRYKVDQPAALDQVTMDVPAGQTVALVGPSGAGKSSLVHLLPRFIEPTEGQLLLDGVALQDWQVDSLRQQFALVSQDVVLFNDSVAANVALGAEVDMARVRQALQDANLLDFVLAMPQGLDTPVGHNGNQLSGGQRQRLAIARAIYKNAPILILDEATSALDAESEHLVQQALDRLMQGRTTLVIAHRLATIERADRIVVMDAGRLVEQGPHHELLAAGGLYARLHAMQFRS